MVTLSFWDKIADKYAARPIGNETAYGETLDITRSYLPEAANVLEIGCGTGTTALRLAADVDQILGTDLSPRMVEIATKRAVEAGVSNVQFQVHAADASDGGPYDAVIAFNLLHLLDDIPKALADAHRVLADGGVFVSKSGCLKQGWFRLLRLPIWVLAAIGKAPRIKFLTSKQLDQMFLDAGFTIERAQMLPPRGPMRVIVARKR